MNSPLSIVYVLVTSGRSRFATMTYLSVQALRRMHPESHVRLLCDQQTKESLYQQFPGLLKIFDDITAIPCDIPDVRMRSRYVKTLMREVIAGDFVFLDADTLPIRRFDGIVDGPWDMAAVQDRNHHCPIYPRIPSWRTADYQKLGWEHPLPKFFNTGVLFLRDNSATRALSDEWKRRWHHFYKVLNDYDDQFPFNSALYAVPLKIHELDSSYNAMVRVHAIHARKARIYHFYAGSSETYDDSLLEHLLQVLETTGEIDWPAIDRSVALNHPWMPPYWRRRLWQTGNYWLASRLVLERLFRRTTRLLCDRDQAPK